MERFAPSARLSLWLGASIAATASLLAVAAPGARAAIGTPERVADINPGPLGSNPTGKTAFGRSVVFRAASAAGGDEPWVSDGTAAGTVPLEISPGPGGSTPGDFTSIGDEVVFLAVGAGGDELWRTDGTAAGTMRVLDINPGPASSFPRAFLRISDQAVFRANDGVSGTEPWRTDGTAAGTTRVDVNPGPISGVGGFFFPVQLGDQVLFQGSGPVGGSELWRLPVTGGGADLVAQVNLAGDSNPLELTPVGARLYFIADDGIVGRELWRSDGQPGGDYALVRNFDGAATDSGVTFLTAFGSHVYFQVDGDGNAVELWRSDGTPAGTEIVADINPTGNSNPQSLTPVGDWLYFSATDGATGRELWRSDGMPGGTTERVADINPGGSSICASANLTPVGDAIYFCADDGTSGNELWRTDGTAAGTSRVADINPGAAGSSPSGFVVHGDTLYLSANDGVTGAELWAVDTGRPDTTVVEGPAGGEHIADRTPGLQLGSTAVDLDRYECATSAAGPFETCAGRDGAAEIAALEDGDRSLMVWAVDVRGNADDTPASLAFTVDTKAPRIALKGKRLKLSDRGAVAAKLLCRKSELSGPCKGKLKLKTARRAGPGPATLAKRKFKLKPGKAKRLRLRLKPDALALVRSAPAARLLTAQGRARDRLGNKRRFKQKRLRLRVG